MARVKLLERVRHDGERFEAGDVLEVGDAQARQLIDSGSAVKASGNTPKSEGTPVEPKTSRVKESMLGQGKKPRKSVSEKAQARAKKAAGAKPAVKPAEVKTPAEGTESSEGGDNTQPPAGDQDEGGTTTVGNDPKAVEFKIGDDEYSSKPDKNGVPQYRKNGTSIKKVDFIAAQKEAGEVA